MQTDMMQRMSYSLAKIVDELDTLNRILTECYYMYGEAQGYDFSKEIDGDSYPRKMRKDNGRTNTIPRY